MQVVLDDMSDASRWSPLAPDGVTASNKISIANDTSNFTYGTDKTSALVTSAADALDHSLRRTFQNAVDLTNVDEIRLWVRSPSTADGTSGRPFFLKMRLASAAMGLDDQANTWHRYLPVFHRAAWELVRLSINDLAQQVRGALKVMELRVVAPAQFECNVDALFAVRDEMISDVEAEMVNRLDKGFKISGTGVPARVYNPDDQAPLPVPHIRIMPRAILLSEEQATFTQIRTDFTDKGFRLRSASVPYFLYYDIDAYAAKRDDKARLFEFVLRAFAPRSELVVNGLALPVELVNVPLQTGPGQEQPDRTTLRFRVKTLQQAGVSEPSVMVSEVSVEVETATPA